MLQIKRNTKEYKDVKSIISDYAGKAAGKRLIKLYALKPYASLEERVLINSLSKNADVIYALTYDSLQDYFYNKSKKLFREDNQALYYFKSTAESSWVEFPF